MSVHDDPKPEAWQTGPPEGLFDPDAPTSDPTPARGTRIRVGRTWAVGDHVDLAGQLLLELESDGQVVHTGGAFWRYVVTTGIWEMLEFSELSKVVQAFSGEPVLDAKGKSRPMKLRASDIKGAVEVAGDQRHTDDSWFNDIPAGLAFANGFLRVTAAGTALEPFDQNARARHAYPFPYDERADAREWLRFLAGLFAQDDDAAEKVSFIQEFFGASLLGLAPKFQRALFATGGGRNGKSTLFAIVRSLFPPATVSEVAPHALRNDYSRASLAGKLLNIVAETATRELLDTESFKALVTGDPMQARHPYGRPFTLWPRAGHAYAPQELPDVADTSDGFWRRPVVIEFRRRFTDADDDKGIAERLITTCKPAIIAWLVEGAHRLLERRAYTLPASHDVALKGWRMGSNNVALFASERSTPALGGPSQDWTLSSTLYDAYRTWATASGYRGVVAHRTFGMRLNALGIESRHIERGRVFALRLRAGHET